MAGNGSGSNGGSLALQFEVPARTGPTAEQVLGLQKIVCKLRGIKSRRSKTKVVPTLLLAGLQYLIVLNAKNPDNPELDEAYGYLCDLGYDFSEIPSLVASFLIVTCANNATWKF